MLLWLGRIVHDLRCLHFVCPLARLPIRPRRMRGVHLALDVDHRVHVVDSTRATSAKQVSGGLGQHTTTQTNQQHLVLGQRDRFDLGFAPRVRPGPHREHRFAHLPVDLPRLWSDVRLPTFSHESS